MLYKLLKKFSLSLALFGSTLLFGQIDHVKWSFSQKKLSADEYELSFTARIDPTWHLYSQIETADIIEKKDGTKLEVKIVEDGLDAIKYRKVNAPNSKVTTLSRTQVNNVVYAEGPTPTSFQFVASNAYQLIGKTLEPTPHETKEPMFDDAIVRSFEIKAVFTQKVKILSPSPVTIVGYIDGQTCNESQCQKFSPSVKFTFVITDAQVSNTATTQIAAPLIADDSTKSDVDSSSSTAQISNPKEMTFEAAPAKQGTRASAVWRARLAG